MNPATVPQQGPSLFAPIITAQAQWLHALCSAWPHDPGVSGIVRSTVPVVFLNGTADDPDPPANVASATATMPNALLVAVPGTGHWTLNNATDPGCLLAATTAFIQAGPPAQRPGTPAPAPWPRNSCQSRHPKQRQLLPLLRSPGRQADHRPLRQVRIRTSGTSTMVSSASQAGRNSHHSAVPMAGWGINPVG